MKRKSAPKSKLEGVLDFETDPFKNGRVPKPFAGCVLLRGREPVVFWGDRCAQEIADYLRELPKCTLWAHNGGKFDFYFLLELADTGKIEYRGGRIVKFTIGDVTLRDSYPLIPVALAAYEKIKIDYKKFERKVRQKNRDEITNYLIGDCRSLLSLLDGYREIVGRDVFTVGAAAFKAIKACGYKIEHGGPDHDERFRPYFFGGRVEALRVGPRLRGPWEYVDINSAYPFAMLSPHPKGTEFDHGYELPETAGPWFARIKAVSNGLLPVRGDDGILEYPRDGLLREFHATGWEIVAGLETGTLDIREVMEVLTPCATRDFSLFVKKYWKHRQDAKKKKNVIGELAYKLTLNSGYGKWAQNPEHFKEYRLEYADHDPGGEWDFTDDVAEGLSLWERPSTGGDWSYYNVAVAASITGYVRAMLWLAMCKSKEVIYCDTDSMICRAADVNRGDKLGEWKLEGIATSAAIAGKKMYALAGMGETASKGAKLTAEEIQRVAGGEAVTWKSDAPAFHPTKGARFVKRTIKRR